MKPAEYPHIKPRLYLVPSTISTAAQRVVSMFPRYLYHHTIHSYRTTWYKKELEHHPLHRIMLYYLSTNGSYAY